MKLNIFKIHKPAVFCVILLPLKSMLVSAQVPVPQFWQLNQSPNPLIWDNTPWNNQIDNGSGTSAVTWTGNEGKTDSKIIACKDIIFGGNPGVGAAGTVDLPAVTNNVKSIAFRPAVSGDFIINTGSIKSCFTDLPVSVDSGLSPTVSSVFGTGSFSFTKNGSGTLILTGANTYTGVTNVNSGVLQIGKGGTTGTTGTGKITVYEGMLDFNRLGQSTFAANGGPTGSTYLVNPTYVAKAGTVIRYSGTAASGSNIFILGNTTAVRINMEAGSTLDIASGRFNVSSNNSAYNSNLGSLNIASGAQLYLFNDSPFFDALTGSGQYYEGWINNLGVRKLTIGISNTVNNAQYGVTNNTAEFAGVISLNGYATSGYNLLDLIKVGTGTQILSGNNLYRNTTISGGVLQVGNNTTTGTLGNGTVVNNATLKIYRSDDMTFPNVISGTGNVIKEGANTVTMTVANTYTGGTTINGGVLQIGNAGTTGTLGTGPILNNGELKLNRSNNFTIADIISGTGTVTKNGGALSNVTLTGDSTYTGGTTINTGTLTAGHVNAFGTGTIKVKAGATLNKNNLPIPNIVDADLGAFVIN